EQDQYVDDRIRLLGINRNGPAGVLPPGARGSITVTFLPKTFGAHVFSHFTLAVPGPDVPLDWSGNKDALRPEPVRANAWDAVYAGFRAGVGTTVGQLQAALAANATRLSQHGEYTPDVSQLFAFELQQADDHGTVSERYALGAMGRGRPGLPDLMAVRDTQGNLRIQLGGRSRVFYPQPGNYYTGAPGDAGVVLVVNGTYQVRESDGSLTAFRSDGRLDYYEDAAGNRTTAVYTGSQLTALTDAFGGRVDFAYNAQGRISQITDPVGRVTTFTYDASGEH